MIPDPTDEIRAIKRKLSEKFDNDIHRIAEDARRRQIESGRPIVPVPSPSPTAPCTANHRSTGAAIPRWFQVQ